MSHILRHHIRNIATQSTILSHHSETEPVVLTKGAASFKYKVFVKKKIVFGHKIDFNVETNGRAPHTRDQTVSSLSQIIKHVFISLSQSLSQSQWLPGTGEVLYLLH